ncbi:MAG: choice-of-anchor D domain-containing protein [Kofleriaceae bacterium]
MRRWFVILFVFVGLRQAAAATATVEFGAVAIGSSQVRYLNASSLNIDATTLTSAAIQGDPDHWFSFAGNGCDGGTSCTFVPAIDLSGTAKVVAFRCSPPIDATGTHVAQLALHGTPVDPTAIPLLVCAASSGLLEFTPPDGILDFGGVDLALAMPTAMATVTIKNIGAAPVTIAASSLTGADASRFVAATVPLGPLAPGASIPIAVTYTPIAERMLADPDRAQIDLTLTGPVASTVLAIQLRGHGIARHASLVSVGSVPDTFVNPGGAAPKVAVTIANTGEAALGLSLPSVTAAPVWSIENPSAVDVPGGTTYSFVVRFYPDAAGPAPATVFTVHTSDPAMPVITATLAGSGKDRMVAMGPPLIDLAYAGIGTTVTTADRGDQLAITNHDPVNTFRVRSFTILDANDAFAIELPVGTVLQPASTATFEVAFTPPFAATFDATAVLRLDDDPEPAATVALHGEGVFVAGVGGGGCSAGGDAGGGAAIAIALLVVARRKRRPTGLGPTAIAGIAITLGAGAAHANPRDLDLSVFDPTPATSATWFQLQSAEVGSDGDWALFALASYANQPLILRASPNDSIAIRDRMMFELGGAFAFGDRFEIGVRVPLYWQSGEDLASPTMFGEPGASGTAFGNLVLHAKATVVRRHGERGELAIGTAFALGLPTATDDEFAGSSKPQLDALALVSFAPAATRLAFSLEAGAVLRATTGFHDIDQGNGLRWGAGASYRIRPALALDLEVFGELDPGALHAAPTGTAAMGPAQALDAIEALAGVDYQIERRVNIGLAAGRGLTSAPGMPAWRGVLAVTLTPGAAKPFAAKPVYADSDHDGIPDYLDRCPNAAEDKDGFEDDDGCPDSDNDHDGIADAADKCPNAPEDRDGFEDQDGCPDLDNDHDGIPDRLDKCPDQPETINGLDDDDGCPDTGAGAVTLAHGRLSLAEPIRFTGAGKIAPESFNVMGQLGATLRAQPELTLVVTSRVKGRAQVVVAWLVQYGIAAQRLASKTGGSAELDFAVR